MSLWLAIGTAIWLGILTSISPCPMATNIAAISFIGRQVGRPRFVLFSGGLYALGRTLAYVLLAALVLAGLLAGDVSSRFLQKYLNLVLGPVLIIAGMILLGMLGDAISLNLVGKGVQERAAKGGLLWSAILGFLFALSFCPVSAGLYFGALMPLAAGQQSPLMIPGLYGIGTAIPVVAFAFLIAFGSQYVGKAFNRLTQVERWLRITTGVVFILAGIYLSLTHVYGVPSIAW
jgi:cytochrome c biogenesis protein CcdA